VSAWTTADPQQAAPSKGSGWRPSAYVPPPGNPRFPGQRKSEGTARRTLADGCRCGVAAKRLGTGGLKHCQLDERAGHWPLPDGGGRRASSIGRRRPGSHDRPSASGPGSVLLVSGSLRLGLHRDATAVDVPVDRDGGCGSPRPAARSWRPSAAARSALAGSCPGGAPMPRRSRRRPATRCVVVVELGAKVLQITVQHGSQPACTIRGSPPLPESLSPQVPVSGHQAVVVHCCERMILGTERAVVSAATTACPFHV
jgi:hypothetical protein